MGFLALGGKAMAGAIQPAPPVDLQPPPDGQAAPAWHTALLILILVGLSFTGYVTSRHFVSQNAQAGSSENAARLATYGATLVEEWLLFLFVLWGERMRSRATVGQRISVRREKDALVRDIGLAALAWGAAAIVNGILSLALHPPGREVVLKLVPHTLPELALWVPLAASAGFCEEYIFRGYFQRQFGAFTGNLWAAVVIQALIFGFAHGYQGAAEMLIIFCLGLIFGIVAKVRRSLRPTMFAHAAMDFFAGVIGYIIFALHLHLPLN
jgi:uncharacterized protein